MILSSDLQHIMDNDQTASFRKPTYTLLMVKPLQQPEPARVRVHWTSFLCSPKGGHIVVALSVRPSVRPFTISVFHFADVLFVASQKYNG